MSDRMPSFDPIQTLEDLDPGLARTPRPATEVRRRGEQIRRRRLAAVGIAVAASVAALATPFVLLELNADEAPAITPTPSITHAPDDETPAPVVGPDGFAGLRLGMTPEEVRATGDATLHEDAGGLCRTFTLTGDLPAADADSETDGFVSKAERVEAIPASVMRRVQLPAAAPGTEGDRSCRDPEDCDFNRGGRHLDTKRAFTADEMKRVQTNADASTADVGDLVAFLFGTGARISEALRNTAWSDVDLDAQSVHVRGTKTRHADRVLALSDGLTERLRDRASTYGTNGQVFGTTRFAVSQNGANVLGRPRNRQNVLKALRKVLAVSETRWAGSHSFRRTVATWMDAAGAPLAEIGAQLGHGDLNVTAHYLGRTTAPTRAASIMILDWTATPSGE